MIPAACDSWRYRVDVCIDALVNGREIDIVLNRSAQQIKSGLRCNAAITILGSSAVVLEGEANRKQPSDRQRRGRMILSPPALALEALVMATVQLGRNAPCKKRNGP